MKEDRLKIKVQRYIVAVSILLMAGKFMAYLMTHSVGILTDAMESIVNVTAGLVTLYSLHLAAKPKDEDHPFGHGKAEFLSASLEGLLITLAGGIIIYKGVERLFNPVEIQKLDIGIFVVAAAGLVNYLAGWYSIRTGRKTDSIALVAGGKHLHSDTYSTVGLVMGLIILYFTKMAWIDSVLAFIFGTFIIVTGFFILKKTTANLMDKADEKLLETMVEILSKNRRDDWVDIHNMKVVKYGSNYYIDCDLTLPWYYNIRQGHAACNELRRTIAGRFPRQVSFSIHSDPCKEEHCPHCVLKYCQYRLAPLTTPNMLSLKKLIETDEQRHET